jgi:hypothetical protein
MPNSTDKTAHNPFDNSAFAALTIGIPFCVFKFLFGLVLLRKHNGAVGLIVITWAVLDIFYNLNSAVMRLTKNRSFLETCFLAQLGKLFCGCVALSLGIDTFLSFSIICFMLWSGWISELHQNELYFWYGATTINLMSLAVVNILVELRKLETQDSESSSE